MRKAMGLLAMWAILLLPMTAGAQGTTATFYESLSSQEMTRQLASISNELGWVVFLLAVLCVLSGARLVTTCVNAADTTISGKLDKIEHHTDRAQKLLYRAEERELAERDDL